MLTLSSLYRYPVKSLRGESLQHMTVGRRGPEADRQWMLVDENGRFLTQRELPRMALIRPQVGDDGLWLSAPDMPDLHVSDHPGEVLDVQIWRDRCSARSLSASADAWFSSFLQRACRLVVMPQETQRQVDMEYARKGDEVGFADGFPFLLISRASLDDLNQRLPAPVPMTRFRPNLVVEGCEPYAEDNWRRIRIGALEFRVVKPCSRCIIPCVDPNTGERRSNEPLKTLMSYRKEGNKVYFGQNLLHDGLGELEPGMNVEILE